MAVAEVKRLRGHVMKEYVEGHGCCDPFENYEDKNEVNGECPDCGTPTVNGQAAYGCAWSPVDCDTCGHKKCDFSC